MTKLHRIGLCLCGSAIAALLLVPAAPAGQTVPEKPAAIGPVVDMGTYRVSAPGAGWQTDINKEDGIVVFTKVKNSLLNYFTMQRRALGVNVKQEILNIYGWRCTEKEAIDNLLAEFAQSAFPPGAKLDYETLDWDGKKIYSVKSLERSAGVNSDDVLFLYPPPDLAKSHAVFEFEFIFVRPGTQYIKLFNNPGTAPARAVIKSLEIVDPLQSIPGTHGDLVRAAAAGQADGVLRAIDAGADVNAGGPERGALSVAAFSGHREIVELLLGKGALVDPADAKDGRSPLLAAIIGREPEIALDLISKGANVNRKIDAGGGTDLTPLMFAVAIGHPDLARALIEAGAALEARSGLGESALILAADNGWADGLSLLLERGGDVNARMNNGWTALMRAATRGHVETVRMLLDNKAEVDLKTTQAPRNGWTALMLAVDGGHDDVVRELLDHHADVNAQITGSREAALHGAANLGRLAIAKTLIDAGADINMKTTNGSTPLMVASEYGQAEVAKLLIDRGADINAKNDKGQTALAIAKKNKQGSVVRLLQPAKAK